jgi:hypothetical protein
VEWLALFGAFLGGVIKGWIGESSKPQPLDPLVREDREDEINRKAREAIR